MYQEVCFNRGSKAGGGGGGVNLDHSLSPPSHFMLATGLFMILPGRYLLWWNITLSALCSCWGQVRCRFITVRYSKQTRWPLSQNSSRLELFCDSGPWPKQGRQDHCSSFRTFTFWRPKKPFYSRGTKESFLSILARQTVPIGLDDPQSVKNISELLINWPFPRCKKHKHKKRCQ